MKENQTQSSYMNRDSTNTNPANASKSDIQTTETSRRDFFGRLTAKLIEGGLVIGGAKAFISTAAAWQGQCPSDSGNCTRCDVTANQCPLPNSCGVPTPNSCTVPPGTGGDECGLDTCVQNNSASCLTTNLCNTHTCSSVDSCKTIKYDCHTRNLCQTTDSCSATNLCYYSNFCSIDSCGTTGGSTYNTCGGASATSSNSCDKRNSCVATDECLISNKCSSWNKCPTQDLCAGGTHSCLAWNYCLPYDACSSGDSACPSNCRPGYMHCGSPSNSCTGVTGGDTWP